MDLSAGGHPCVVTAKCSLKLEKSAMTTTWKAAMDAASARWKRDGSAKLRAGFLPRAAVWVASSIQFAALPLARQRTTIPVRARAQQGKDDAYGTGARITACVNQALGTIRPS